jgi:hypothetical protein
VVDWTVEPMLDTRVDAWISGLYDRMADLNRLCKVLAGCPGLYVEPSGLGPAILGAALEAGHIEGLDVHLVPPPFARLDLSECAAAASRYLALGRTEFAPAARDKKLAYRGLVENHLTAQITRFNPTRETESPLARAFYLGVLLALENPPREH